MKNNMIIKEFSDIISRLARIQSDLKAPKGQRNSYGGYNYRSCEDILEAVKPLLAKEGLTLLIDDSIEQVGERYYVKATATLYDKTGSCISNSALAREELTRKGMDASQITGATSSYARKYALNGLFAIDDTKDADATNKGQDEPKQAKEPTKAQIMTNLGACKSLDEVKALFATLSETLKADADIRALCNQIAKKTKQTA